MSRKKSAPDDFSLRSPNGRLGWVRATKGYTLKQLSELTGLTPGGLSDVERGKNDVTVRVALALKKATGVNIEWLLTGEGKPWAGAETDQTSGMEPPLEPEVRDLAKLIATLDPDQRQAVEVVIKQFQASAEKASTPADESRPKTEPKPKPQISEPSTQEYALRSGNVINLDEYRARLSQDAQDELTDKEVAELAQFEDSALYSGVHFHNFDIDEIFTASAERIRELLDTGRRAGLC